MPGNPIVYKIYIYKVYIKYNERIYTVKEV